jgi:nitroreductase
MAEKELYSEGMDWNPVEEVILKRRSVRAYHSRQVPESLVRRILEAGRFAPSAGNCQPWKFIVIQDKQMLDKMTEDVRKSCKLFKFLLDYRGRRRFLLPITKLFIRLRKNELHPIPFGAIMLIAEGKLGVFHDAPTAILILKDKRGASNPDVDCGIAGQNMVLAAHSLGLGTCWVGFVKPLNYNKKWKKRLGIEYPYELLDGIALGYPKGDPDGFVSRETQEIDWYVDGTKKTIY